MRRLVGDQCLTVAMVMRPLHSSVLKIVNRILVYILPRVVLSTYSFIYIQHSILMSSY